MELAKELQSLDEIQIPISPDNVVSPPLISQEYTRLESYRQLLDRLQTDGVNESLFALWLSINNIVTRPQSDPVFFESDEQSKHITLDSVVFNDKEVGQIIRLQSNAVIERIHKEAKTKLKELSVGDVNGGDLMVSFSREDKEEILVNSEVYRRLAEQFVIPSGLKKVPVEAAIERILLRYEMVTKPKYLPQKYYEYLENELGVTHNVFATPFEHYFDSYGSDQLDVDQFFGSVGSIMTNERAIRKMTETGGSFEVNLLHYGPFHSLAVRQLINKVLAPSKKPIILYITYNDTVDQRTYSTESSYVQYRKYDAALTTESSKAFLVLKNSIAKSPRLDINKIITFLGTKQERQRFTIPVLTIYEKVVAIAKRADHLDKGGEPTIRIPEGEIDSLTIAEMELENGSMPILILRPDGEWDINTLVDYDSGGYKY